MHVLVLVLGGQVQVSNNLKSLAIKILYLTVPKVCTEIMICLLNKDVMLNWSKAKTLIIKIIKDHLLNMSHT